MKRKWKKLRTAWWEFWEIYEEDNDVTLRLSGVDKKSIWYVFFIMSLIVVVACMLGMTIGSYRAKRWNEQDMKEMIAVIAAYLATATEDEYDEIAETIRHDLVFDDYRRGMAYLIPYIPNMSEKCSACQFRRKSRKLNRRESAWRSVMMRSVKPIFI